MRTVKINQGLCSTERQHETEAWTDEELRTIEIESTRLWNDRKKYRYSAVIMILALTGCRAGELVNATWDDVDFDKRTFAITGTYTSYKDYESGKFITGTCTPKTPSSRRTIELTDSALYWFKELKRRNEELGINSKHIIVSKSGKITNQRMLAAVHMQAFYLKTISRCQKSQQIWDTRKIQQHLIHIIKAEVKRTQCSLKRTKYFWQQLATPQKC